MRVLLVAQLLKARNFQPLGLEYLSAHLKRAGHQVAAADASFHDKVISAVDELRPDIIGYYACTGLHRDLIRLNDKLKRRFEFFAAFGGPHATFFPEMIKLPGIDGVCRGEGEQAIVDLANALEDRRDYCNIPNWWFSVGGRIVKNEVRPLVRNLDELGAPDWSLTDAMPYCRDFPVKIFMASHGCPHSCAFCYSPAYRLLYRGQKARRTRDPLKVVDEIELCREGSSLAFVYLFDDTFGIDPAWVSDFCRAYKKKIALPFYVNLRADLITENIVRDLAWAGLAFAGIGLESGCETIRNEVLNKGVSDVQLKRAAAFMRANNTVFSTFNMLGIPGTTLDQDIETWRMNLRLRPNFAEALMFQPYPRTKLGDKAKKEGLFSGNPDDVPPNFKGQSVLNQPNSKQRLRLLYLFPIIVAYPPPPKILRGLLRLPLTPLYRLASRLYEGAVKIFKIYRISLPPRTLIRLAWHYLRY